MSLILPIATDLIAITVLAYVLYFRRHRRRDLLLAYAALNVGVLAVTISLSSVDVGIGLGIGLFGILSIIRLRSDQITQQEIAYYFVSLTLGLLAGLNPSPAWIVPVLSALMLLTMAVVDSPHFVARSRRMVLTLDRAFMDESSLRQELERRLVARVTRHETLEVDTVRDITVVDVRYQLPRTGSRSAAQRRAAQPRRLSGSRRSGGTPVATRVQPAPVYHAPLAAGASETAGIR